MFVRRVLSFLLLGASFALAVTLALQWFAFQDVLRERDTLNNIVVTLSGRLREAEERLARVPLIEEHAAYKAASVIRDRQAQCETALAAANVATGEAREQLAVQRLARENAERSLQETRERLTEIDAKLVAAKSKNDTAPPDDSSTLDSPLLAAESTRPAAGETPVKKAKARARKKHAAEPSGLPFFPPAN